MNNSRLLPLFLFSMFFLNFSSEGKNQKSYEYKLDKIYAIAPDGTLDLKTHDADIRIIGSDRKDVHLKVFRSVTVKGILSSNEENFRMDVEEIGGNLIIRELKRSYNTGVTIYSEQVYKITIEIPKTVSLKLRGDDDNYHVDNVNGTVKIDLDDGDVILENCGGYEFDLDIADGNVEMSGAKGQLWLTLEDGDLKALDCEFETVEIRADDGDIRLETSLSSEGNYSMKVDDGNIDLKIRGGGGEIEIRHDDGRIRASQDFELAYAGDSKHKFKLVGGNARVFVKTEDGKVNLNTY